MYGSPVKRFERLSSNFLTSSSLHQLTLYLHLPSYSGAFRVLVRTSLLRLVRLVTIDLAKVFPMPSIVANSFSVAMSGLNMSSTLSKCCAIDNARSNRIFANCAANLARCNTNGSMSSETAGRLLTELLSVRMHLWDSYGFCHQEYRSASHIVASSFVLVW